MVEQNKKAMKYILKNKNLLIENFYKRMFIGKMIEKTWENFKKIQKSYKAKINNKQFLKEKVKTKIKNLWIKLNATLLETVKLALVKLDSVFTNSESIRNIYSQNTAIKEYSLTIHMYQLTRNIHYQYTCTNQQGIFISNIHVQTNKEYS